MEEDQESTAYVSISGPIGNLPVESLKSLLRIPKDLTRLAQSPKLHNDAGYRSIDVEVEDGVIKGYKVVDFPPLDPKQNLGYLGKRTYTLEELDGN